MEWGHTMIAHVHTDRGTCEDDKETAGISCDDITNDTMWVGVVIGFAIFFLNFIFALFLLQIIFLKNNKNYRVSVKT